MREIAAGVVVMASALGGCATLTRGTSDEVAVISEPAGAAVTTSLGTGCVATPCTLVVARDAEFTVTITKTGYASQSVAVATRISSIGVATATENISTAGLGLAVDAATGAVLEHVPNPVSVVLASLSPPAAKPARPGHSRHT
ncbi:MAG: hypothetical protein ACRYGP_30870 [Janthinobacterium lividum]